MRSFAERHHLTIVSCIVDVEPIVRALGKEKAECLPIFCVFTGADNTGKFSGVSETNDSSNT